MATKVIMPHRIASNCNTGPFEISREIVPNLFAHNSIMYE
jgi:hypothetical protein